MMTIFFDFDSTVVSKESLDEVIALALNEAPHRDIALKRIAEITNAGMEGTLPFTQSITTRLAAIPLTRDHFATIGRQLLTHITPDLPELFTELRDGGHHLYIISGGFRESILPVTAQLGVSAENVFCNQCLFNEDEEVTGVDTTLPTYTDEGKTPVIAYIEKRDQPPRPFLMVGDGANDLAAYQSGAVELFCGFTQHAQRTTVIKQAPHCATTTTELRDFIFSLETV